MVSTIDCPIRGRGWFYPYNKEYTVAGKCPRLPHFALDMQFMVDIRRLNYIFIIVGRAAILHCKAY